MFKRVTLFVAWCAMPLLPVVAHGQISITNTDVLSLLGKTQISRDDSTGSVTVNVGAAGANQTWDFRAQVIDGENTTTEYVQPQTTPYAAQFPQANFTQKFVSSEGTGYLYAIVSATSWREIGLAGTSQDTTFILPLDEEVVPLPLQFGRTWTTTSADTLGDPAIFATIIRTVSTNSVDAWGTIRLPLGDLNCLRTRHNRTITSLIYTFGMLTFADSTKSIDYSWATKTHGLVASVSSQEGETNPNFTNAASISLLQSTGTAVDEREIAHDIPNGFALAQNYPNPFARSVTATTIHFALPQATHTELAVFTLQGERVRVLTAQTLPTGSYNFKWDGRDDAGRPLASGTYLYRLQAGEISLSRALLLIK